MSGDRSIIVFVGPTLPVDTALSVLEADYRPPVAQGDLLRAVDERPDAIGIIDGYFERVPAVWHKEILWAMQQGIHVFGAASMGALRAAELAFFGMEGVGKIFEAFHSGELEDDDEVALIHTTTETGYDPSSEAMVNIRATLDAAVSEGDLRPSLRAELLRIAKALYFPERNYENLLRIAASEGLPKQQLAAFGAWLPEGRVDQKRLDAIAMLEEMGRHLHLQENPKTVGFTFQNTDAWLELQRTYRHPVEADSEASAHLLNHLQEKNPEQFAALQDRAWSRIFGLELAQRDSVDDNLLANQIGFFCREKDLLSSEALDEWLQKQEMPYQEFLRLMRDNLKLDRLRCLHGSSLPQALRDLLRLEGS